MTNDLVFAYFAVGLGLLAVGRMAVALYYRFRRRFMDEVMAAARSDNLLPPENRREVWKSFGMGAAIGALWPAAIVALFVRSRGSSHPAAPEPEFWCQLGDLIEVVRPSEVEAIEKVADPLGKAPGLPFGHLHAGWVQLKQQVRAGDNVWRFTIAGRDTQDSTQRYVMRRGVVQCYAIVRRKRIVVEFVSQWDGGA